MKSSNKRISKIALIFLMVFTGLIFNTNAQSVFVGKSGSKGKILKKYVEPGELKKLVENPLDSIWIVDVRSEKAFQNGHIPTAKSFPSGEIIKRLNEIRKDQYLILYCTVGGLARVSQKKLKKEGYKRTMVWGGISRWEWERETGK